MSFSDEYSGLLFLGEKLSEWQDELPGVVRVELNPYNKHDGSSYLTRSDRPMLFLETISWELKDAIEALRLWYAIKTAGGEINVKINKENAS
jgi:hypothetical protein